MTRIFLRPMYCEVQKPGEAMDTLRGRAAMLSTWDERGGLPSRLAKVLALLQTRS